MSSPALPLIIAVTILACFVCGLIAVVSPARFSRLAVFLGRWVETRPTLPIVDARVDVDAAVLRHSRLFGICVVAAAGFWLALVAKII